jgi:quinoprotein glucose dehydrogenase
MVQPEDPVVSNFRYDGERFNVAGPQGLPIIKPPYSRITAIDLDSGEHEWMIPHGEGIRQKIIDMGIEDPGPVGSFGRNGPLLTKSLLFFGQFDNGRSLLRSYNKATGDIISELEIPLPPMGTPMTYAVDGKQYIAMAVGAGPDTKILAVALP